MRTYQQTEAMELLRPVQRGETTPTLSPPAGERALLSSGTEDYFTGTYYFNRGMFHNGLAGLTHKTDAHSQFSAYRAHVDEPLIFGPPRASVTNDTNIGNTTTSGEPSKFKFSLVWRNGDPAGCVDSATASNPAPSRVFAYVFAYLW